MNCTKCGAPLEADSKFCMECGTPVEQAAPLADPVPPVAPVIGNEADRDAAAKGVMVWGIIGIAFSCSFFASILGFIFSLVAKKKVKAFEASYGPVYGMAKVGRILAKVGVIVGIILSVFFIIYLIVIIAAAGAASALSYM